MPGTACSAPYEESGRPGGGGRGKRRPYKGVKGPRSKDLGYINGKVKRAGGDALHDYAQAKPALRKAGRGGCLRDRQVHVPGTACYSPTERRMKRGEVGGQSVQR